MPKVGGRRKKSRTHKEIDDQDETSTGQKIPKTFILKRGDLPNPLKPVIGDMREVMYPHTAMKLRESSKNRLKDFISTGHGFGVTHMLLFSSTSTSNYLRFVKLPDGPTLTFKILNYSTHKDIVTSQKKPRIFGRTLAAPLLILNGFNNIGPNLTDENRPSANHYNLVYLMMQNMYPPLDLAKAKIHNTKKAVMFNLDQDTDTIDFRYYGLRATHTGINKNIKQLLEAKKAPNLKNFKDISEYILRENDYMSENEVEDTLEEEDIKAKGANKGPKKMTVKLYEVGPRMTLQLIKIEEGLLKGNVVYHRLVKKTAEEVDKNRKKLKEKARLKEQMKKKQEEVVNEKMSKKLKKEELKRKKQFLDEQREKHEEKEEGDDEEFDKEMEEGGFQEDEEEEEKSNKKSKPFDLSKGKRAYEEQDEEEEDDIDEEDEIELDEEADEGDFGEDMPEDVDEY